MKTFPTTSSQHFLISARTARIICIRPRSELASTDIISKRSIRKIEDVILSRYQISPWNSDFCFENLKQIYFDKTDNFIAIKMNGFLISVKVCHYKDQRANHLRHEMFQNINFVSICRLGGSPPALKIKRY